MAAQQGLWLAPPGRSSPCRLEASPEAEGLPKAGSCAAPCERQASRADGAARGTAGVLWTVAVDPVQACAWGALALSSASRFGSLGGGGLGAADFLSRPEGVWGCSSPAFPRALGCPGKCAQKRLVQTREMLAESVALLAAISALLFVLPP